MWILRRVEGALEVDALDDLVEELVQLNRSRQRSYFHAGFRDVLFGREIPRADREMNEGRALWYWAGVVNGLARQEAWEDIADLYDQEPVVRRLGQSGEGASFAAGQLVLLSLCRVGRAADAGEFVTDTAATRCSRIFESAFHEASRLLREDRAAEARGLLDRLGSAVATMEREGIEPHQRFVLEVRRRRAHCFRQLGEFGKARQLLQRLERDETDSDIRAMVLADLGLIEGGFRRLGDLHIPRKEEDIPDMLARIESGMDCFERATDLMAPHSAHAQYVLGVYDLLDGTYARAVERLERAKSVFAAEASRYGQSGVMASTDLALGIAMCMGLQAERMEYGTGLITGALSRGAELPAYMVGRVLESLALAGGELVERGAESILNAVGPEILDDVIAIPSALDSEVVASALLERAGNRSRGPSLRAEDYRSILPSLLRHAKTAEAAESLDYLEEIALSGVGTTEFLHLLGEPQNYEPAWDPEDARWSRVMCLESVGEYETAAIILAEEFHRVLVDPEPFRVEEARSLVDRIRTYGLPSHFVAPLDGRLLALQPDPEEVIAPDHLNITVGVLFVGGDERQAQYDEVIRGELAEEHPQVKVTFMHPGWGSNWIHALEEAERKLANHDALVVMRFNRTQLGRQLRKRTPVPWWSCGGSGKRAIKHSILAAASVARAGMRERIEAGGGE